MGLADKDRRFIRNPGSFSSGRRWVYKYRVKKKIDALMTDMAFLAEYRQKILECYGIDVAPVSGTAKPDQPEESGEIDGDFV